MSADETRFAVATFTRVSDPYPVQDALTLPELTAALSRFMVKPGLREQIDEEIAQIERAAAALTQGHPAPGKAGAKLEAVAREARERGLDPVAAVRERARALATEVRHEAKRGFRLWAPLCIRPGGRRDPADVVHASCLVLDYNDGTPIAHAHELWRPWFHLLHTTWSHRPGFPMFRVVLPLAQPLGPEGLLALWRWAEARVGSPLDPEGMGVARAYPIPVVPDARAARRALTHEGPLLDAAALGLAVGALPPPPEHLEPGLLRRDPEAAWVEGSSDGAPTLAASRPYDDEVDAPRSVRRPRRATDPAPDTAPDGGHFDRVLAGLDAIAQRLDALGGRAMVDALERLALLHEQGALDDIEYRLAKARVLAAPETKAPDRRP